MSDTRPVRASEQLDWEKLAEYLREHAGARGAMTVQQFPGGHSNLTYLLSFKVEDRHSCLSTAERNGEGQAGVPVLHQVEMVLRRPPFGPVPPRAHDMVREARVLAAVHPAFPLAPKPLAICEDTSVIGAPFYVMERRRGVVIRSEEPPELRDNPELRKRVSESVIDTLASLHRVDVREGALASIGKPAGFVRRQVEGWTDRWQRSKTTEVPEMEQLAAWLAERIPSDPEVPALVHGDFKLDNVMLDANDLTRVVALFDWEMSALGDPLVDVGILLCYWVHAATLAAAGDPVASVTTRGGWVTRDEILARYASSSGRDVANIAFYEAFALFKLTVVVQQIFARYFRGQTDDPRFAQLDRSVALLSQQAAKLTASADRI